MRPLLLLAALLAAGCTHTGDEPLSLVDNPHYQALGYSPRWTLAIGEDDIALRLAMTISRRAGWRSWTISSRAAAPVMSTEAGAGIPPAAILRA